MISFEKKNIKKMGGIKINSFLKRNSDDRPLISIITVVFNGEKYLENTILSVLNQTYNNIEYIIIDGGSTDNTIEIIKKYENRIDYWISEKDNGIYDAMNKGILVSSGIWLSFLGSDDVYNKDAIENYYNSLKNAGDVNYVFSKIQLVDNCNNILSIIGKNLKKEKLKKYMCVPHVGSLHHRSLFTEYGLFDISYKIAGDYEFLLRVDKSLRILFMDKITVSMMNEGVSNQNIKKVFKETLKLKIKTGKRNKLICYFEYFLGYFKMYIKKLIKIL